MGTIPIKTVLHGDKTSAMAHAHHGVRLMAILERFMDFQGIKQCSMRKEIEPGLVVEASKVFGLRRIDVFVGDDHAKRKQEIADCLCNCDFALGFVVEVVPELLDGFFQLYNVAVCFQRRKYVLRENILASDFALYAEGEKVLLVPYNEATFNCCTGTVISASGCKPMQSEYLPSSNNWRTVMRIIPWCAASIPKWINRREVV